MNHGSKETDRSEHIKSEEISAAVPREIDCIDCPNRPTHIFHSPVKAVNLALMTLPCCLFSDSRPLIVR